MIKDENLPVDEYMKKSFGEKVVSIYEDESGPLYDDMTASRSELDEEIDQISEECSERNLHPLVLAALKYGKCRR